MSKPQGWIKLHRSVLDHPRFGDGDWLKVWMFLLCKATHTEYRVIFGGKDIMLRPGQLVTSRPSIVDFCRVERSKVERILGMLESEQQIEQRACSTSRLITILNWAKYQKGEQQIEPPVSSKRATSEQQVSTNKNAENGKNEEKKEGSAAEPPPPSSNLSDEDWMKSLVFIYGSHIDVAAEQIKYLRHCETKKRKPSRTRFGEWLNRIDGPWKGASDE